MVNFKKVAALDPGKQRDGVWFQYEDGLEFLVASISSPSYRDASAKVAARRGGRKGMTSADKAESLKLIAQHILLDWRGMTDDEGLDVPYSKERALEFLQDSSFAEWSDWVVECAQSSFRFREDALEASGN